jgi:solute:Na+ symporter, SSS family
VQEVNWIALGIFVALFGFITWLGFAAAHWRKGDLDQLHEWGLGGRRFGTLITWFLVGGDVYTAYTFIAVPALAFGAGAVAFFAVPYTIIIYPLLFLVYRRLWHVCHKHGYITAGDFVRGRFGNRWLALAVTITGIVATMPYIALQLVGIQVVIGALGVSGSGLAGDLPLIVRGTRRLHVFERTSRTGVDRDRQGHLDLRHGAGRYHRDPDRAGRFPSHFCGRACAEASAGGAGTAYDGLL